MTGDWLFPQPRSTPGDPAAYWPDTGFLELPAIPLTDAEVDRLEESGGPRPAELPLPFGSYLALAEHEQTHWIQTHACAYGRFQARIDLARTEIAESFFGLFPKDVLHVLLDERRRGASVLELDERQRPRLRGELGPVAARLQRHWWMLGLIRHELDSVDSESYEVQSDRRMFGLAALYADAGPLIGSVALLEDDELVSAALARAPAKDLQITASTHGGRPLSTSSIAECAAMLNQHWFYAHQAAACRRGGRGDMGDHWWSMLVQSWESKELTYYGDAFAVYGALNPHLDLNATIPLATLGVICHIALDGLFPTEHPGVARWEDIAPPLRFIRLAGAVKHVGLLPAHSVCALEAAAYHEYAGKLCHAAEIARPQAYPAERLSPKEWDPLLTNHLRHLQHDAAIASAALLASVPSAIVAPAEANIYRGDELLKPELDRFRLAREAPLLIVGGMASSIGIGEDRFWRCAIAGAYQRLMLQLFGDARRLRLAGLPTCDRGRQIVDQAIEIAQNAIGSSIPLA